MKNTFLILMLLLAVSCGSDKPSDKRIKQLEPAKAAEMAKAVEAVVKPIVTDSLTLKLWGVDSLVADPIAIDIDDAGKLYYTRTNRQKHSEFDIRSHQDWEIESIRLQTIDDKRAFLHKTLSPENSSKNKWLDDLNGDGSRDWKDMTVEKENVYRLEDTSGDGVADLSQLVVDDFHDEVTDVAGGVLIHNNDLFVAVGPDLWRVNDTNGDGLADKTTSISTGYGIHIGFGGHGMSGVEVGPDGKIYWQIGDIGFNGTGPDGKKWEHPNSGVIVRSNADGSDFEVFAYGVRNTHEFVFDEFGNLISVDNDGDHPGEKERLVYIVDGSDTGWRSNWQYGKYRDQDNNTYKVWMDEKMYTPRYEGQAAYLLPPIANYINGPAGMVYNPGTALGPKWKNTFFAAEFVGSPSQSGVHAFKLNPKGASFELGETKMIVRGLLPTGLDFGPDGAMYIADWIDGWNTKEFGRIWKLEDGPANEARKLTQTLLADDFSKYDDTKLGDILHNEDMRVRQKAQFELAARGKDGAAVFKKSIGQKEYQLARVHGIWGIAQLARKEAQYAADLVPLLKDSDPEIRAQAARWLGDIRYEKAGDAILPLLTDEYSRARFFAAEALGRIAYAPAIQPIVAMLEANKDEDAYLRHAGSLALSRVGKTQPIVALANHPSRAVRIAAVVALRRMRDPGITAFLNDKDEYIVTEASRAINDDLSIEKALPALGDLLAKTTIINEAFVRRAINANIRVGTEKAMQNLLDYSLRDNAPAAMRAEAIAALSTWPKPSVVDRVDGRYRGEVTRDVALVREKTTAPFGQLMAHKDATLRVEAIKAAGKLGIASASPVLFTRLKSDPSPAVREEALRAIVKLNDPKIGDAITTALADKEKRVRVAGLDLLPKTTMDKNLMAKLLSEVIANQSSDEKQAAVLTLGTLPLANSQPVFDGLLTTMSKGKLSPEIHLELAEAVDSTHSAPLIARYREIISKLAPDSVSASYEVSLLGGDPDRGRGIFFWGEAAQCIRCHAYDDYGGNAGPRLNGIASRLTREQILEALVKPSARLAPGYGMVTLELKTGKKIRGVLQQEKANGLVLKSGDKPDTLIATSDIAKRINAESSMPQMRFILSKREIRDVVSFLSTLKE